MPNVMVALPNIGGALCSTPQIWLTPTTRCRERCTDAKPVAASGPKFTILCGHVEDIFLLNKFFSDCRYMP